MVDFDINRTAGSVLGIAGMGIGLGLLAHTAMNISRTTDQIYERPRGRKDGSQTGRKTGGRGRNRTTECRHPEIKRPNMYSNYWGVQKGW